jgi:rubrerythrin
LIPLSELPERIGEIDSQKTTFIYCRSGNRAGSAAALLARAGFGRAYNVGGLAEWNGLVASGPPEAGMAVFDSAREPAEYIRIAWEMEEGARRFYEQLGQQFGELEDMFQKMAVGEEQHRDQLGALHREVSGQSGEPSAPEVKGMMEGGIRLEEALSWAREANAVDVLEFAAAMEANAHDRYITVGRAVGGATEKAFVQLAEAEKGHLNQLLDAFQQKLD